jgi:hypothetical protein
LLSPRCRSMPGAEPIAPASLESSFLASPRRSGLFPTVLVSFLSHFGGVATAQ